MLGSNLLQLLVFPVGALYLLLHLGPLLRLWYEPSIRGGTRWPFFGSEVALFLAWLLCSPVLWHSPLGRLAIAAHLSMHVVFTTMDYLAHDFLIGFALTGRGASPLRWLVKELGLVLDTATHAVAVILVARALPLATLLPLLALSLAGYAWVTRGYLRRYVTVPGGA